MTLLTRWVSFLERRHRPVLAISLIVAVVSAFSLLRLRLDIDVLNMLPAGLPAFDNFKTFVADFGELDELIVLLRGTDPERLHTFADRFSDQLHSVDGVVSVQGKLDPTAVTEGLLGRYAYNYVSIDTYDRLQRELSGEGMRRHVEGLRQALQSPLDLSAAQWIRRDPLGFVRSAGQALQQSIGDRRFRLHGGYLSNAEGTALLLFVHPEQNAFDIDFTTRFMAGVHAAEAAVRAEIPDVDVGYTGSYAFALEDAATIKGDVARYTVLALVGVLAVFFAAYRNLRILPLVTYPLLLCTLLTFVGSLAVYDQLNAVSTSFAAILYGLSIDSGIHFYTRLLQERRTSERMFDAVHATLAKLGGANVVASLTTAAAFLVIGFSRLVGVSQLGILTAFGMLLNIGAFFVLYPALSFWASPRVWAERPVDTPRIGRLAAAASRRPRFVLTVTALLATGAGLAASHLSFDVDLTHLRPSETPTGRVQDAILEQFGGEAQTSALLVRAADVETALQDSEALLRELETQRQAGSVLGWRAVTPLLPSRKLQRKRLEHFAHWPRAEVARNFRDTLSSQGFRLEPFQSFLDDFTGEHHTTLGPDDPALAPLGLLFDHYIRRNERGVTVATYVELAPGVGLEAITNELRRALPEVDLLGASRAWLEEELGRVLRVELLGFCLAAFALNFTIVWLNVRNVARAITILLPQAVVILAFFALTAWLTHGINPINLIVVPLILGIGVDNCVYIVERTHEGVSSGDALSLEGRALVTAAFTTVVGFGFLAFSRYPALAQMGELAAICLVLCLALSMTFLPALLALLEADRPVG